MLVQSWQPTPSPSLLPSRFVSSAQRRPSFPALCAAYQSVIQRNVDFCHTWSAIDISNNARVRPARKRRRHTQLDKVPDEADDEETGADSRADLDKLLPIRCPIAFVSRFRPDPQRLLPEASWTPRILTLLAPPGELHAVSPELERSLEEFLYLARHCCGLRNGTSKCGTGKRLA